MKDPTSRPPAGPALTRLAQAVWFGHSPAGRILATVLRPLAALTRRHAREARRQIARLARPRPPVLVVGNLLVGGTGKTPLVIGIARALSERGLKVGLLCSGYRARRSDAREVRAADDALEQGDEAVLLAHATGLPVAAGRRRDQALACLLKGHPGLDLVISDDGLQHRYLPRSLELVVFDRRGLGNGLTLPAGPLREPIHPGQIFPAIAVNDSEAPQGVRADRIFNFRVEPIGLSRINTEQSMSLAGFRELFGGERLCALAGIGEPGRFFDLLSRHGIATGRTIALADHAPIAADTLSSIDEPLIVMTAKDAVKCRDFADDRCWVLDVEVRPDPQLLDWLQGALLGNETA